MVIVLSAPVGMVAQPLNAVGGMPEDLLPELRAILRDSLQRSPQMISNDVTLAQAEAMRIRTDAALYPNVNASISYGVSTAASASAGVTTPSSSTGLSYTVSLGQPIFHWGALKAGVDIGRISLKIAERNYAEAYRMLAGTIRSQYLSLIAKKAAVRYAQQALTQAEGLLLIEEEKFKNGTISAGELSVPQLSVADARLNGERLTLDFESSKKLFARLAGLERFDSASIPNDLPRPVHSPQIASELVRIFLKDGAGNTNQGQVYLMNVKQADLNYRIARTGLYPKFSLAASTSLSISTQASPGGAVTQTNVRSNYYGLNTSWTLFDGLATRGAKLYSLAGRRAAERTLQAYAETTVENLQVVHQQLQFSARALDIAEQRHALAAGASSVVAEDFRRGLTSRTAADAAATGMLGADIARIYARSDYLTRWSDFVSQTGADPVMTNLPARYVRSIK
ncbi:MAG TPA: TolC family protein [Opitutaceae bacterium]|nr:TolC family protein [Opitutaceae bacterium]